MKKSLQYTASILTALVLLVIGFYSWISYSGNIHEVIPGTVIRSAQLNPQQLNQVLNRYRIRSIIDMSPGNKLHNKELQFSRTHHIRHFDLGINVHGFCPPNQLLKLTQLIETAPKPLLVHCRQGIDRTGLASAIAAILYSGDLRTIKKQISYRYADMWPTSVGIKTITKYIAWCQQQRLSLNKHTFTSWINSLQTGK